MSSAVCFPINSFDSQAGLDVIRSPHPEATVTHTSIRFYISLLFAHVLFSLKSYGWVSPSEKVGLIIITLYSCSSDDSPQHSSEVGASGLKTKEKWWCRGIQGMCNKVTECSVKPHKEVFHFWSFSWSIGSSRSLVLSKICQQPLTKLSWYLESWSQEDATNCIKMYHNVFNHTP